MAKMRSDEDFSKCADPRRMYDPLTHRDITAAGMTPEEVSYITSSCLPGKIEVVPPPEWVRVTFKIVTERGNCIECEGKFVSDATFACLQELLRHQVKV